jgi:c-di-GMP-binding flagellar brake protein YcgR
VTGSHAVARLLDQLRQHQALLTAHWRGEPDAYGTMLLAVHAEHEFFVLDELTPRTGHAKLVERQQLTVLGRLDGVGVRFHAAVREFGSKEGVAFYKCPLPAQIQYLQRRDRHRVSVLGFRTPFTATRGRDAGARLTGTLHDVSAMGLGLLVDGDVILRRGDILTGCTFRLAQDGEFRVDLEVRYTTRVADRRITRVGTRMLDTDRPIQRRLEAAIARLERELARRSRPD